MRNHFVVRFSISNLVIHLLYQFSCGFGKKVLARNFSDTINRPSTSKKLMLKKCLKVSCPALNTA